MSDADFMRLAIQVAWEGVRKGEMPFGACVVRRGQVVSVTHNSANANMDTTAHAEVEAIRDASRKLNTLDLTGCSIDSTSEPCPMCFAACLWANIQRIFYACRIDDAKKAGVRQIPITAHQMKQFCRSRVELHAEVLREDSLNIFKVWSRGETQPATKSER